MDPATKIQLLRELTRGADDVFAMRHERSWRPIYAPLSDYNVTMHLKGIAEIGSYPLIPNAEGWPAVRWVAADFDGKIPGALWKVDVRRAVQFLIDMTPSLLVNLSRSGRGAHVRVLFNEPVPAWMARRWMLAWLEEAGVARDPDEWDEPVPPSFDRLIPPQDTLSGRVNDKGYRLPGNLIGSPLHGKKARTNGGTLPLDPRRVERGDFTPDGRHWDHVTAALDSRTWGADELRDAMREAPGEPGTEPPQHARRHLTVIPGDAVQLDYVRKFCFFMRYMQTPGEQPYPLWLSLASQLHRFGDAGHDLFHEISSYDPRYNAREVDRKWDDTAQMAPIRCDTLVEMGYRCPHLTTPRCNGAAAPAYFAEHTDAEIL